MLLRAALLNLFALRSCNANRQTRHGLDLYHRIANAKHRGELILLCNRLGLTGNAAEVGVNRAHFSRHNLELWEGPTEGKKYYMIDSWAYRANDTLNGVVSRDKNTMEAHTYDVQYNIAKARVLPWLSEGRAVMIRRFSEAAVLDFPDSFFDFIYIDAGHEYHNVARDLALWWPKLAPGGMFAGDDFADGHDTAYHFAVSPTWGVKSALANFSATVGSPFFLTFADRKHLSYPMTPLSDGPEFDDDPEGLRGKAIRQGIPSPVRSHSFFPAWYMFK
uniref:Class I SAM-dependent methyltransferase n=1 Tax=Calcidiscus leptoporus TaxID=127549 RepID=A0A7S0NTR8_9EUKA|mmetsp:Transcript_24052/g.55818  ORF Transcript_24052/g.55818 Transcript_24052/m.55818 type:complete len:276 (+) Transcript_24052:324-1151(+)